MDPQIPRRTHVVLLGAVTAALVALTVSVPRMLTPRSAPPPAATVRPAGGCPTELSGHWAREDRDGPLVPPGAVRATLCFVPTGVDSRLDVGRPLVLDTGVEQVVEALNALPTRPRTQYCSYVGYPQKPVLMLGYRYRPPVVVQLDVNCRTAVTSGRVRSALLDPRDAFVAAYRRQLAAARDDAPTYLPSCPAAISARVLGRGPVAGQIDTLRGVRDGLLPMPLVASVACRYVVTGEGSAVLTSVGYNATSRRLRDLVNSATAGIDRRAKVWCGIANDLQPTAFDTLRMADVTGGTTEIWVIRAPCTAVVARGPAPIESYGLPGARGSEVYLPAPIGLLEVLDGRLGPPV